TNNSSPVGSQNPQSVGADAVPNLSLPKTVVSSVDNLIGAGGVIQTSPDNMTIYNLGIRMRLLGGVVPHDELLGPRGRLSSWSFWGVEASIGNVWTPLVPRSSNFTVQGTNSSGTYLIRSMRVSMGLFSGTLRTVYRTTPAESLKWTLEFFPDTLGLYRLAYSWWNTTNTYTLSES